MSKPAYPVLGAVEVALVLTLHTVLYLGMRAERRTAQAVTADRSHS